MTQDTIGWIGAGKMGAHASQPTLYNEDRCVAMWFDAPTAPPNAHASQPTLYNEDRCVAMWFDAPTSDTSYVGTFVSGGDNYTVACAVNCTKQLSVG